MRHWSLVTVCTVTVLILGIAASCYLRGSLFEPSPVRWAPATTPHVPHGSLYPALYVSHGAGPMPVLGDPAHAEMVAHCKANMADIIAKHGKPTAVAVVSAHYSTEVPSFGAAARPAMYYDYGGFPKASYALRYDAPGAPALAMEMVAALQTQGIASRVDPQRPLDHGVFVPLMLMLPDADIPVVPVSVLHGDDPATIRRRTSASVSRCVRFARAGCFSSAAARPCTISSTTRRRK